MSTHLISPLYISLYFQVNNFSQHHFSRCFIQESKNVSHVFYIILSHAECPRVKSLLCISALVCMFLIQVSGRDNSSSVPDTLLTVSNILPQRTIKQNRGPICQIADQLQSVGSATYFGLDWWERCVWNQMAGVPKQHKRGHRPSYKGGGGGFGFGTPLTDETCHYGFPILPLDPKTFGPQISQGPIGWGGDLRPSKL